MKLLRVFHFTILRQIKSFLYPVSTTNCIHCGNGNIFIKSSRDLRRHESIPIITKTWNELLKNPEEVGRHIFNQITNDKRPLFEKRNPNVVIPTDIFMRMVGKVIMLLNEPVGLDDKLMRLGEIHIKSYGVKLEYFRYFQDGFMKTIKLYIPWNDRREFAWLWFWSKIIYLMSKKKLTIIHHDKLKAVQSSLLVDGFIRSGQRLLRDQIIPEVVNEICFKFHHICYSLSYQVTFD